MKKRKTRRWAEHEEQLTSLRRYVQELEALLREHGLETEGMRRRRHFAEAWAPGLVLAAFRPYARMGAKA